MTLTDDIFRAHADVIEDASDFDIVPPGWRDLLVHLAAGWAEILHADGSRIRLKGVAVHAGGMLVTFESGDDPAPSSGAAQEIQRLRVETQYRSLRTCDLCGKPGVLRFWPEEVFAVRCDHHVGIGRVRGWREMASSADLVANLLISHRGWLLQAEDAFVEVPWGWVPMLVEAFARFRRMPTGRGFLLRNLRAVRGRLDLCMEHDAADLAVDEVLDWQAAVRGLGDAALFTCDVCGDDGCPRRTDEGISAPRCDDHADHVRWPSHQWWASPPEEQTRPMITSARPTRETQAVCELPVSPIADRTGSDPGRPGKHALYALDDVKATLGLAGSADDDGHEQDRPSDSEQQARLRRILRVPRIKKGHADKRAAFKSRPLSNELGRFVAELVAANRRSCPDPDGPMFTLLKRGDRSQPAQHFFFVAALAVLRDEFKLEADNGEPLRLSPRRLRYSFATRCVAAGMSEVTLMGLLDHSNLSTVMVYFDGRLGVVERLDRVLGDALRPLAAMFLEAPKSAWSPGRESNIAVAPLACLDCVRFRPIDPEALRRLGASISATLSATVGVIPQDRCEMHAALGKRAFEAATVCEEFASLKRKRSKGPRRQSIEETPS